MTATGRRQVLILLLISLAAFAWLVLSSLSPLRGTWQGDFDGDVAGTVEFRIGIRGHDVDGTMSGSTRSGEPFTAELEGRLVDEQLIASFEGRGRGGALGVAFVGTMEGTFDRQSEAFGTWRCRLERLGEPLGGELVGEWRVVRGES